METTSLGGRGGFQLHSKSEVSLMLSSLAKEFIEGAQVKIIVVCS